MWQKCPICNGLGSELNEQSSAQYIPCSVCGGMKIINENTGKPPKHDQCDAPTDLSKTAANKEFFESLYDVDEEAVRKTKKHFKSIKGENNE